MNQGRMNLPFPQKERHLGNVLLISLVKMSKIAFWTKGEHSTERTIKLSRIPPSIPSRPSQVVINKLKKKSEESDKKFQKQNHVFKLSKQPLITSQNQGYDIFSNLLF